MKKNFTTCRVFMGIFTRRAKQTVVFLCSSILMNLFLQGSVFAQIPIPSTTAVVENFDGMGAGLVTPANWRVYRQAAAPTWALGITTIGQQASSGTPATGAFYNWGTSAAERALGVMTSGGFPTPNSIMAFYSNTNTFNLNSLTVAYDLERYRVNTTAASLTFFYSTNGTAWTSVPAGNIAAAALPTGASAYNFSPSGTPGTPVGNAGVINKSGISITGLNIAPGGAIYLRWELSTGNANSQGIGIDNVSVTAAFTAPTLVLSDNALSGFTYAVGAGPSAAQTFTVSGVNLTGFPGNITVTGSADYEVSVDGTNFFGSRTIAFGSATLAANTVWVRLIAGRGIGNYNGQTITVSGGGASNETVTCNGSVTNLFSSASDVVVTAGTEAAAISSLINNPGPLTIATGIRVWGFVIRDGGAGADADLLPTIVNSIVFAQAAGNQVSDWSQAIESIGLFDGVTLVATGTVTSNQVQFTGLSLTVPDGGIKPLTIRLSLKCPIGAANKDGDDFGFSLANGNFTTASSATSSQKAAFPAIISVNGLNVIDVVATKLVFTQQPSNVSVNASINPAVIVTAMDACNNIDRNFASTVTITSTGTLTNAQAEPAINGIATFPGVSFSAAGAGVTLTASFGAMSIVSTPFNVTTTTLLNPGDLMIVGFDTWSAPGGTDKISIANLVPLLPNTQFSIANMVYEWTAAAGVSTGRWYNGNGNLAQSPPFITIQYNGGSNLAKGSVICITIAGTGAVTDISVNGVTSALFSVPVTSSFVQFSSADPDAFFLMQGTFSADLPEGANLYKTFTGTVFGGIQTRGNFQDFSLAGNAGGSRVSRRYPTLKCVDISMPAASSAFYGYYNAGALHNGSQHTLISAIGNTAANWTTGSGVATEDIDNLAPNNTCSNTFTVTSNVAYGYWVGTATSTDWYDCHNWDNFSVPTSTINVLIDGTALNDCQISATSTEAAQFGYKADANNVNIVGRKLIIENTGATINRLDLAGNIVINTANGLDMNDGTVAIDGTINLKGNWVNNFSNGFDPGQSLINFNGTAAPQSITFPDGETFYKLANSNTNTGVVLTAGAANLTVTDSLRLTSSQFILNDNTLNLNGNVGGAAGTITGSALSSINIGGTAGGPLGTLNFTAGGRLLKNLTLNRTGAASSAALGTDLSVNTLVTITAGILDAGLNTLDGAGGLTMTAGELQLGKISAVAQPELSGTYTLTAGVVNFKGTGNQTIRGINYYDLTSTSTGARVMSNVGTIGVFNTFTKGTNAYTFTGSTVNYNGPGAQNITPFVAGLVPGSTYDNLTLSNTGVKSLTANTDVEGALSLNDNITLRFPNNVFMGIKASATKTARIAPVSASAVIDYSPGSGRFVIERYYPTKRAWRLVTAPVTVDATKTFYNSWQAGGASPVGVGTFISGPGESPFNGLDFSAQHNFSLKNFNELTSQFDGVQNTKTTLISGTTGGAGNPDNVGYFFFCRGDRTAANTNAFTPAVLVTETTIKDTGKIQVQNYTFNCNPTVAPAANIYTLIGNPYASPVDFASLTLSPGVVNKFQTWDPTLNTVGGWVVVDLTSGPAIITPASAQTQIIQSQQAFLVTNTNVPGGTVTFGETAKSSVTNLSVLRPGPGNGHQPASSLAVSLHTVNSDGSNHLADGVLAQYSNDFNDAADYMDALKFGNINETFGIVRDNQFYQLERRRPLTERDTVFFSLKKVRQLNFRFNLVTSRLASRNLTGYLQDTYRGTSTAINMNGDTWFDFTVDGNAASAAANRFYIIFRKAVNCQNIHANILGRDVHVGWSVKDELDVDHYETERSVDGVNFEKVSETPAVGDSKILTEYASLDLSPAPGVYFYRVKGISKFGGYAYSETVKIKVAKTRANLYVYPNPVTGGEIGLQMNMAAAGKYQVRLLNSTGQVVLNRQILHNNTTATEMIAYPATVTAGTYQLEVTGPDKKKAVVSVVIADR